MTKELVVDLSTMPGVRGLDNVEGITLGPKLSDGRQAVVLVTDDNFNPEQADPVPRDRRSESAADRLSVQGSAQQQTA